MVFELSRPQFFEKNHAPRRKLIIRVGKRAAKVITPYEPVCSCGTSRTIEISNKIGPKIEPNPPSYLLDELK